MVILHFIPLKQWRSREFGVTGDHRFKGPPVIRGPSIYDKIVRTLNFAHGRIFYGLIGGLLWPDRWIFYGLSRKRICLEHLVWIVLLGHSFLISKKTRSTLEPGIRTWTPDSVSYTLD